MTFHDPLAKTTDIAPGTTWSVQTAHGDEVLLCNVDGAFYAIANVCTHDGWPLDQGELCGTEIECPRHGARFDVTTGAVVRLPAVLPVPTYAVCLEGTAIYVDAKAQR